MAPARAEADDPVTAEYDVYLTSAQQEQIYLLQYLNRSRERPYSQHFGAQPTDVRIKPKSGYLELEVELSTSYNFNKYQGLKWGDALSAARTIQNEGATYGPASGLGVPRGRPGRGALKDKADRETQISNDLSAFRDAEEMSRVMHKQTLGGQIMRYTDTKDADQPIYYLGAFQGNQLHLSKVDATVQMRPQFHHIDAEEHRNRLAASRAAAAENGETRPPPVARGLAQSYKPDTDDKDKDAPERLMRKALQDAEEESWVPLDYIDEAEDAAFEAFSERMFLHDEAKAAKLKSTMDNDEFLDAVSMPRFESPTRRRKRKPRARGEKDIEDDEEGETAGAGAATAATVPDVGTAETADAVDGAALPAEEAIEPPPADEKPAEVGEEDPMQGVSKVE